MNSFGNVNSAKEPTYAMLDAFSKILDNIEDCKFSLRKFMIYAKWKSHNITC